MEYISAPGALRGILFPCWVMPVWFARSRRELIRELLEQVLLGRITTAFKGLQIGICPDVIKMATSDFLLFGGLLNSGKIGTANKTARHIWSARVCSCRLVY